jgi:hypothetical protein
MPDDVSKRADKIIAEFFDRAGNAVSGLDLSEIGLEGHQVANTLWKIAGYLRRRGTNQADQ